MTKSSHTFVYTKLNGGEKILYRLKNIYGLDTLGNWIQAFSSGLIIDKKYQVDPIPEYNRLNLLEIGIKNCLPIQIVCCRRYYENADQYYAYLDPRLKFLIDFINGDSVLMPNKKKMYFREMADEKRERLLQAQINSVWVQIENEEDNKKINI